MTKGILKLDRRMDYLEEVIVLRMRMNDQEQGSMNIRRSIQKGTTSKSTS